MRDGVVHAGAAHGSLLLAVPWKISAIFSEFLRGTPGVYAREESHPVAAARSAAVSLCLFGRGAAGCLLGGAGWCERMAGRFAQCDERTRTCGGVSCGCLRSVIVKLVVQVKLEPTPKQAAALEATLHACNEAATWVSEIAFERGEFKNFALRKHTYEAVKSRWSLGAQAAQHSIKKACDAYTTLKANLRAGNLGRPGSRRYRRAIEKPIVFRPWGAQPYDDRMLSWQIPDRTVSIWTTRGRVKNVAFTASVEQLATLALYRKGESDLLERDGMWFLNATCEVPEAPRNTDPVDFLGIDLGIVNIATTSDGEIMAGRELNRTRLRERGLRAKLQQKNTPSAKRRLRKRRRKEARRARDINHKIAKHVVAEAERTGRGIALEDLTGSASGYGFASPNGPPTPPGRSPSWGASSDTRPAGRGGGGVRRSGVHLPHLCRVRPHRQGEPGLAGLVRVPELRIR